MCSSVEKRTGGLAEPAAGLLPDCKIFSPIKNRVLGFDLFDFPPHRAAAKAPWSPGMC
jgi:hypothetical protein